MGPSLTLHGFRLRTLCRYLVNLLDTFFVIKSYGEMSWKGVLENVDAQSWTYDRLLRTAVLFHILKKSL
jgi:hypothetical protein